MKAHLFLSQAEGERERERKGGERGREIGKERVGESVLQTEAASHTDACHQSRKHANVSWGGKGTKLIFFFHLFSLGSFSDFPDPTSFCSLCS